MAPKSKQAERNASKRAAKKTVDDEPEVQEKGDFVAFLKSHALESVLATIAPKLPVILKEQPGAAKAAKPEQAPEKAPEGEGGEGEGEAKTDEAPADSTPEGPETSADVFERLNHRLGGLLPLNGLGLWHSPAGAKEAFLKTKALKFDGGPKAKKKGNPAVERMLANGRENFLQYFHFLFALMLLRSFLFRSFFAFLPWMFFYQTASVMLPLTNLEKLPQVPIEKCPVKFRVAGAIGLHALVWFFFLYEVVIRTYIFEKILIVGLFAAHGYLVAPVEP